MNIKTLKYGYYQEYFIGDGSMYDHCTAYKRAYKHYTIFDEDSTFYYDILDENKPYKKNAQYGETLVTVENELSEILPSFISDSKNYTLEEILAFMPKMLFRKLTQPGKKKVL